MVAAIDSGEELAGAHGKWPTGHDSMRKKYGEIEGTKANSPRAN
jgi:hypothetical protein